MTNAFNLSQLANNTNSSGQVALGTGVSGTLPVANGGTGVTTSTGTGAVVLSTSPTLVTPLLGTPTSGNLANCTGIPAPAALSTASGSAPSYSARAWVNFNGTGTVAIRASGNVSSITDNGAGDYTVNFTTAMPDANYAAQVTLQRGDGAGVNPGYACVYATAANAYTSLTTAGVRIITTTSATGALDVPYAGISIFR
jgi:hypothetical protein